MRRALILLAFFAMAATTDALSVWWQTAREAGDGGTVAALSMALEMLTWLPVVFALRSEDYTIVGVTVVGSAFGAWVAMQ